MSNPATITTVASTVATISVDGIQPCVEVFNVAGTDTLWLSDSATSPTVGGQGFWPLPPGMRVCLHPAAPATSAGPTVIKVISAGINTVTAYACEDDD